MIELKNISFRYDNAKVDTLKDIDLQLKTGEVLAIVGPSGGGKSTLLRLIAGLEKPKTGEMFLAKQLIIGKSTFIKPEKRGIGMVFQDYALFPHMTVKKNIEYGLSHLSSKEKKQKVKEVLSLVDLKEFEHRYPHELSGGQQQRIAIARAVVNKPKLLLLDEPLGALDLKLRQDMQYELKEMQKALGISFLFVTHDQEEALTMSDTVVVMNEGIIQQVGSPEDIYNEPKNKFTARFIGESNIIDGVMLEDLKVSFGGFKFECVDKGFKSNELVDVVVRPEDIVLSKEKVGKITGVVDDITFKGVHFEIIVMVKDKEYIIHSTQRQVIGTTVSLEIGPNDIHVMRKSLEELK